MKTYRAVCPTRKLNYKACTAVIRSCHPRELGDEVDHPLRGERPRIKRQHGEEVRVCREANLSDRKPNSFQR